MKKLNLNKQSVITLSSKSMLNLNGGSCNRSNRLPTKSCGYSRRHPNETDSQVNCVCKK